MSNDGLSYVEVAAPNVIDLTRKSLFLGHPA